MSEERFSDLAVIVMHYPERFEAFVKAHPRRLIRCLLTRYVEKRQITIVDTAVPFNHALFLGFWLTNKINSRFYIIPSKRFSSLRNAANGALEGKIGNFFFWGEGEEHGSGPP